MNKIHETAYAKINLALDIVGRRPDGYHLLDMISQTVSLSDDIDVNADGTGNISLMPRDNALSAVSMPDERDNLMYKAAMLMRERYGIREGVNISYEKRIPLRAGLGGGSADAAAVMRAINRLSGLGLTSGELEEAGLKLGADVPYFIRGGTSRVRGIGESLTRLKPFVGAYVLIVKPIGGLSTADVYARYDLLARECIEHPDIEALAGVSIDKWGEAWTAETGNVLEPAALRIEPVIADIKGALLKGGAYAAAMTGSGSAVFGLFKDLKIREDARRTLMTRELGDMTEGVYMCETAGEISTL